jgi:hypothetical protein
MNAYSGGFVAGYLFCAVQTVALAIAWSYAAGGASGAGPDLLDPADDRRQDDREDV